MQSTERCADRSTDPYVALAARAIRTYVIDRRTIDPPQDPPEGMRRPAGVFVSIKKHGALRGCIGTFFPTEPSVAHEIITNAAKSATADPRFPPIAPEELDDLELSVDILSPPESCTFDDLDPSRYGIIVERGMRRGLLLPDLSGVDTAEEQLDIACRKAGIAPAEPFEIQRFTVERHG